MTRLGDLVEINRRVLYMSEPRSVIGLADIDVDSATVTPRRIEQAGEASSHRRLALPGDILFAQISPSMENGKLAIIPGTDTAVRVSTELLVLHAEDPVEARRIWAFLRRGAVREALSRQMVGTVRHRLGAETLAATEIPDIESSVWRRASEILEHLDQATALRRQTAEEVRRFVAAAFATVTKDRERVPLGEIADLASGFSESAAEEGTVRLLGAADLGPGGVEARGAAGFVPEGAARVPSLLPRDLLVVRSGVAIGSAVVYEGDPPDASFGSGLIRVRCPDLPADFLWGWLQTAAARHELAARSTGTRGPRLPIAGFAELSVPAPGGPTARLAELAGRMRAAVRSADEQLRAMEVAVQAHLARVFQGPITVPAASLDFEAVDDEVPSALRLVFAAASPIQRRIWSEAVRTRGPFRARDLIDSEHDRALLQHTLSIMEQLGVLICERDGMTATWRLPHPEEDLVP